MAPATSKSKTNLLPRTASNLASTQYLRTNAKPIKKPSTVNAANTVKKTQLKHSSSSGSLKVAYYSTSIMSGATPRQQRTEFPSVLSHSSSAMSINGQASSTHRKGSIKTARSTQSNHSRNKRIETKTTATTTNKLKPKPIKDSLNKSVLKQSANIQKRSQLQYSVVEAIPQQDSIKDPKQSTLKTSSSLILQPKKKPVSTQYNQNHRTASSLMAGSSQSQTIVNFGETSIQPSAQTLRKDHQLVTLHMAPFGLSTKVGSYLHSAGRSDGDNSSLYGGVEHQEDTRNHSVVRTPFENSKPLIDNKNSGKFFAEHTKHVTLTLSPRSKDMKNQIQTTVNYGYNQCSKKLMINSHSSSDTQTEAKTKQNQFIGMSDHTEDGQIQLSDLEPLSNVIIEDKLQNKNQNCRANLTDLGQNQQQYSNKNLTTEQAGNFQIQILPTQTQIEDGYTAEPMDDSIPYFNKVAQSDTDLYQKANRTASFESPDVMEAARKRLRNMPDSSIQMLPGSLIAEKKTLMTVKQQILLQSAQSYLMLSRQKIQRPNPRIQAFHQKSPFSKMSASIEDSLRCSKISSQSNHCHTEAATTEIADNTGRKETMTRERESFTVLGDDIKFEPPHNAATTGQKKKGVRQPFQAYLTQQGKDYSNVPKIVIDLKKQSPPASQSCILGNEPNNITSPSTSRQVSLQAALSEIRRNTVRQQKQEEAHTAPHIYHKKNTSMVACSSFTSYQVQQLKQQKDHNNDKLHSSSPNEISINLNKTQLEEDQQLSMLTKSGKMHLQYRTVDSQDRVRPDLEKSQLLHETNGLTTATQQHMLQHEQNPHLYSSQSNANQHQQQRDTILLNHSNSSGTIPLSQQDHQSNTVSGKTVMVTDWTEKLKDEAFNSYYDGGNSFQQQQMQQLATSPDEKQRSQLSSRLHCLTSMETQQTFLQQAEGGILLTESCTDGEAIVAAETDEFYVKNFLANNVSQEKDGQEDNESHDSKQTQKYQQSSVCESSSSHATLPVDTIENTEQNSDPLETMQTGSENEDLILENVQNFINMAYLQQTYLQPEYPMSQIVEKVIINLQPDKRLLLLDMDETLIHAATTVDIEINQIYGADAKPDFYTSFVDQGHEIQIGVFKRPFLKELFERAMPYFQICVYTASEKMYADAILDVLDPEKKIFYKRIYRNQCLKAFIPSPANHPMQDLLPNQDLNINKNTGNGSIDPQEQSLISSDGNAESQIEQKVVYIKDLRVLYGVDLSKVVIVDNQLLSFALQPDNGIPISSYFLDPSDAELRYVADYLIDKYELEVSHKGVQDLREVNKQQFKLSSIIEHALNAQSIAEASQMQQSTITDTQVQDLTIDRVVISHSDLNAFEEDNLNNDQVENDDELSQAIENQRLLEQTGLNNDCIQEEASENEEDEMCSSSQRKLIEEQYALHLQKGKQKRRDLLEKIKNQQSSSFTLFEQPAETQTYVQARNSDLSDFVTDPFADASNSNSWQQAASILNQPVFNPSGGQQQQQQQPYQQYFQIRSNKQYDSNLQMMQNANQTSEHLQTVAESEDDFSALATRQTMLYHQELDQSNQNYQQSQRNPYQSPGGCQLNIHQPLQSQVVAEVPEYLETTQKNDRRRDCIFQPRNMLSDEGSQPSSALSVRARLQQSSSHSQIELENCNPQFMGSYAQQTLDSPIGRKPFSSQQKSTQQQLQYQQQQQYQQQLVQQQKNIRTSTSYDLLLNK